MRKRPSAAGLATTFALFTASACGGHAAPARSGEVVTPAPASGPATAPTRVARSVVPPNARSLPNKLLIDARLDQTLTTATPEGFAFSTRVAEKISAADGAVAIPAGTVLRGVVTGIRPASAAKAPIIRVSLDFMELGGRSYGIRSSVFGVEAGDSTRTETAHVLPSDSASAVFPSAPAGLRVGSAIALGPSGGAEPAALPAGSILIVELDSAIAVQR